MVKDSSPEIDAPDPSKINDPQHWLDRAEQARTKAKLMGDPAAREAMLGVARDYERLAEWARERISID